MGHYHLKLPKMGESVAEATVTKWLLEVGDTIHLDDPIVEIATDKVDTDVTSEVEGVLAEKCFQENEVVKVGETLVIIETKGEVSNLSETTIPLEDQAAIQQQKPSKKIEVAASIPETVEKLEQEMVDATSLTSIKSQEGNRYYSPLVRNIANKEGISIEELEGINGSGKDQRITKKDILAYLDERVVKPSIITPPARENEPPLIPNVSGVPNGSDQFREMTRMEGLIADHMMSSLKTSAHVQSFIEVDVTQLWDWREEVKEGFSSQRK